jgi:hypothetical protein
MCMSLGPWSGFADRRKLADLEPSQGINRGLPEHGTIAPDARGRTRDHDVMGTRQTRSMVSGPSVGAARARRAYWLQQYLAMGPSRSLAALAARPSRDQDVTDKAPAVGSLKRWSTTDGWQERARAFDAQVNARATEQAAERLATERRQREDVRTQLSRDYQALIRSALEPVEIIDVARFQRTGERVVLGQRPRVLSDFTPDEITMIEKLHKMAEHTQLVNDGRPTERIALEGGAIDKPLIYTPIDHATQEQLYGRFETMVKEMREATAARRNAQSSQRSIDV